MLRTVLRIAKTFSYSLPFLSSLTPAYSFSHAWAKGPKSSLSAISACGCKQPQQQQPQEQQYKQQQQKQQQQQQQLHGPTAKQQQVSGAEALERNIGDKNGNKRRNE